MAENARNGSAQVLYIWPFGYAGQRSRLNILGNAFPLSEFLFAFSF